MSLIHEIGYWRTAFDTPRNAIKNGLLVIAVAVILVNFLIVGYKAFHNADPEQNDFTLYLSATQNLLNKQPLYFKGTVSADYNGFFNYHYHPLFALSLVPLTALPPNIARLIWTLLLGVAYVASLYVWYRVGETLQFKGNPYLKWGFFLLVAVSSWTIPWSQGNISVVLMLLSALLSLALAKQHPWLAAIVALPILLLKPNWLFPFILPVIQRRFRLLVTSLAILIGLYILVNGAFVLIVGPDYGLETLRQYPAYTFNVPSDYPWGGTEVMFNTTQNSIYQTWLRYFGPQSWSRTVTLICQALVLAAAAVCVILALRKNTNPLFVLLICGLAPLMILPELEEAMFGGLLFVFLLFTHSRLAKALTGFYVLYIIAGVLSLGIRILRLPIPRPVELAFPLILLAYLGLLLGCLIIVVNGKPEGETAANARLSPV